DSGAAAPCAATTAIRGSPPPPAPVGASPAAARRRAAWTPALAAERLRPPLLRVQDDLDVGAPVELPPRLGLVGCHRILRAVANRLKARLGNAEMLNQVFLDRFGALLRQRLVQLGRAFDVGIAFDAQERIAERGHGIAERVEREIAAVHDLVGAGRE